jgi:hypothetical protein
MILMRSAPKADAHRDDAAKFGTRVPDQCSTKMTYQGSRRRSSDNVERWRQRI